MSTRKINARKLAADVKSGVTYLRLMELYSLSETSLDSLLQKLLDSGLVARTDLPLKGDLPDGLNSGPEYRSSIEALVLAGEEATPQGGAGPAQPEVMWECVACGASRPNRTGVCPTCGLRSATAPAGVFNRICELGRGPLATHALSGGTSHSISSNPRSDFNGHPGQVDQFIKHQFKTTEDGRLLFFPWMGYLPQERCTGYLVSSEREYARLHKGQRFWLKLGVNLATIAGFVLANRTLALTDSMCMGLMVLLMSWTLFVVLHILWLRRKCRDLERALDNY